MSATNWYRSSGFSEGDTPVRWAMVLSFIIADQCWFPLHFPSTWTGILEQPSSSAISNMAWSRCQDLFFFFASSTHSLLEYGSSAILKNMSQLSSAHLTLSSKVFLSWSNKLAMCTFLQYSPSIVNLRLSAKQMRPRSKSEDWGDSSSQVV